MLFRRTTYTGIVILLYFIFALFFLLTQITSDHSNQWDEVAHCTNGSTNILLCVPKQFCVVTFMLSTLKMENVFTFEKLIFVFVPH